jgi:hypothetical protein
MKNTSKYLAFTPDVQQGKQVIGNSSSQLNAATGIRHFKWKGISSGCVRGSIIMI